MKTTRVCPGRGHPTRGHTRTAGVHLCTGAGRREQRQRKSPRRETTRGPADGRGERPPSRSAAARPRRAQGRAPETRGRGVPLFRSSKQAKRTRGDEVREGPPGPATLRLWVPLRARSRSESSVNPAGQVCQAVGVGGGAPRKRRGCLGFPGGRRREGGPGARARERRPRRPCTQQPGPGQGSRAPHTEGNRLGPSEALRPREGPTQEEVGVEKGADLAGNVGTRTEVTHGRGRPRTPRTPGHNLPGPPLPTSRARQDDAEGTRYAEPRPAVTRAGGSWLDRADRCPLGHLHPLCPRR